MSRIDLEPASCGDPPCDADHGYTGTASNDDLALRVSRGRRRRPGRRADPGVRRRPVAGDGAPHPLTGGAPARLQRVSGARGAAPARDPGRLPLHRPLGSPGIRRAPRSREWPSWCFFSGTMDCGKSTLALQTDHNHAARGRAGHRVHRARPRGRGHALEPARASRCRRSRCRPSWTSGSTSSTCSSPAAAATTSSATRRSSTPPSRSTSSPASSTSSASTCSPSASSPTSAPSCSPARARLVELADKVQVLQVEALCWCGERGTHNARTVNGEMVVEGEQVVVGDTFSADVVAYEVLCRRHHRRRMTAEAAQAAHMSPDAAALPGGRARRRGDLVTGARRSSVPRSCATAGLGHPAGAARHPLEPGRPARPAGVRRRATCPARCSSTSTPSSPTRWATAREVGTRCPTRRASPRRCGAPA